MMQRHRNRHLWWEISQRLPETFAPSGRRRRRMPGSRSASCDRYPRGVADIDDEASEIVLLIHWIGGVHTELRLPKRRRGQRNATSADIIAAIRQLVLIASDDLIAGILNRNSLVTRHGNRWTRERVNAHRSHHKIPVFRAALDCIEPYLDLDKAARLLGVSPKTLRLVAESGEIRVSIPCRMAHGSSNDQNLESRKPSGKLQRSRPSGRPVRQKWDCNRPQLQPPLRARRRTITLIGCSNCRLGGRPRIATVAALPDEYKQRVRRKLAGVGRVGVNHRALRVRCAEARLRPDPTPNSVATEPNTFSVAGLITGRVIPSCRHYQLAAAVNES